MATSLLNRAQINYSYNGSEGSAVSNQTNTTLVDQYTMTAVKETLTPEIQAGNNAAFYVLIENTGIGTLSGFSIEDDLGMMAGTTSAPLSGSSSRMRTRNSYSPAAKATQSWRSTIRPLKKSAPRRRSRGSRSAASKRRSP